MSSVKFELEAIETLKNHLKLLEAKKVLLVTGKRSYKKSGAKKIIENLGRDFEFVRFKEFDDNPNIFDVEKGVQIFKKNKSDCVLAIGGGSSIDMAKLIKFFAPKKKPFQGKFDARLSSDDDIPFIAIPTTAGTGSEATHFAVLYVGLEKYSISDALLLPDHVAIISRLHLSQTKYQKAVSGLDAFSQAIESFWSVNATDESRDYSLEALRLIIPSLPEIVIREGNLVAHKKMALGAYLAGKAINIAKTTAPHAFSYYLTKRFNLPHGHAVAIFLPSFITYNFYLKNNHRVNYDYKENSLFSELNELLSSERSPGALANTVEDYILNLGVEIDRKKLGIPQQEMILALNSGNAQRLKNNPRKFDFEDFIKETSILR